MACRGVAYGALGSKGQGAEAGVPGSDRTAPDDRADIALDVPAKFRRLSGAVRMIVPPALSTREPVVNDALVKAIARGRRWYEMLASGEIPSLHALAKATGLNERYVSRVLRCAFLAPDIVKAVLDGSHPPHLTLDRLLKGIPAEWSRQRNVFNVQ